MNKFFLIIYDFSRKHRLLSWSVWGVLTIILVLSIFTLHYSEDISHFLPLDEDNQTALSVYQDVSGANRIYAIIGTKNDSVPDPQFLVDGVEAFVNNVEKLDTAGYIGGIIKEIDMEKVMEISDEVYENIPYFLTDSDYERIDSLLNSPGYVESRMEDNKQMLLFPSSNMVSRNIQRDPLNLFSPVLGRLSGSESPVSYESYDGYILTPDSKRAIVMMESSFGASESDHNGQIAALLDEAVAKTGEMDSQYDIHLIGGPLIAVSNASQIKHDSILAVAVASILILLLLIYAFRNARNILLIVLSVSWGWIFALGIIGFFYSTVSIIVIGIASVIIGIAFNYPLHLIDHLKDSDNPRAALKEVISPLVVGNVTTVGAFLCLIPLQAVALHDLGLFASLLLIGTIVFVLIWLPLVVKTRKPGSAKIPEPVLITKIAGISLENNKWIMGIVLVLTIVFGYFSLQTEFDTDLRNINYMTDEQREDMDYFQSLVSDSVSTENLFVLSMGKNWDEALAQNEKLNGVIDSLQNAGMVTSQNNASSFLISKEEQIRRLDKWKKFVSTYKAKFSDQLIKSGVANGFNPEAFSEFETIIDNEYPLTTLKDFEGLTSTAFMNNLSENDAARRMTFVRALNVRPEDMENVKEVLKNTDGYTGLVFDVKSMNKSLAGSLSDDFNYIGIVCGFIVFVFLWISLGRIELALISFLPMAVSWIWILGIMSILGIKFNIVNIILATFIFGQGDDYTIFMTEGLSYELAYRKKLLASYKNSIVISALIMFIGIGTLIFAKHPAMRSLGEVTIVGMLSVVFMAYLFPPLAFNWLVRKNGRLRKYPLTLKSIVLSWFGKKDNDLSIPQMVLGRYLYKGVEIEIAAKRALKNIRNSNVKLNIDSSVKDIYIDDQQGQGELALLLALKYPEKQIFYVNDNTDNFEIAKGCFEDFVTNVHILSKDRFASRDLTCTCLISWCEYEIRFE